MKNILENTPTNWHEVTFNQYMAILDFKDSEAEMTPDELLLFDMERKAELLALFNNISIEVVNSLPQNIVIPAMKKLEFMSHDIPNVKISHKAKKADEVTYQNFVDFNNLMKLQNPINHLPQIVSLFFKSMTEEEILKQSVPYVFSCFFFLRKQQRKLWRSLIFKTLIQFLKLRISEAFKALKLKRKKS